MLIQFIIKNFLSFSDTEESIFKMTATSDSRHPNHVVHIEDQKLELLRTAGIYGANGAGKTNLIRALNFLKNLITKGVPPNQKVPVKRFRLSNTAEKEPARFEIEILQDNIHYCYGIVLDDIRIREEWLFETRPNGRETMLFERVTAEDGSSKFEFGARLKESGEDFISFVAKGTRPAQPFVSEAELRNIKQVQPFINWFRNTLELVPAELVYKPLEIRIHHDKDFAEKLGGFLKAAGTGIESVGTQTEELDFSKHFPGMPEEIIQEILSDLGGKSAVMVNAGNKDGTINELKFISGTSEAPLLIRLHTIHKNNHGKEVSFSYKDESMGTRRLMHLFPILFSLLQTDKVFIIDELDRSLHPLLSKTFLSKFLDSDSKRSQLIFTTHEECLLDLDLLRRDEIWFVEKDSNQASRCYPLTDYKVRPDVEIRKGYLNGRFGAIPFFGSTKELGWES